MIELDHVSKSYASQVAVRDLTLGLNLYDDTLPAILWSVGILIVAFPIGLWLYNRRTTQ